MSLNKLEYEYKDSKIDVKERDKSVVIIKFPPKEGSKDTKEDTKIDEETKQMTEQLENLTLTPEEQLAKEANDLIIDQYGFTTIVDLLIEAKVPIVGHNMIYDVMFLYNQFIDDFPETYEKFVEKWGKYFTTFDTKLLCSYSAFIKKSWLKEAYDQCLGHDCLKGMINFEYHEDFKMYDEEVQEHEASYDAYMTGVVFATIAKEKEITHEFHANLDSNEEYQELLTQLKPKESSEPPSPNSSVDEESDSKAEIYKKIREIKWKSGEKAREDCRDNKVVVEHLTPFENKVVVVNDRNRVFYFGKDPEELKASLDLKLNTDKVVWVKLTDPHPDVEKILKAIKSIGDASIQKDDKNAYFIEFQTIYDKDETQKDIIESLNLRLGPN